MRDERGSATELALAAPLMVMMLLLPVLASRLSEARAEVDGAARAGARAAAMARSAQEAPAAADAAARDELALAGLSCARVAVSTDTTQFKAAGAGRSAGSVRVQVTCTVDLRDVALLGVPGSKALSASFVAPVDALRGPR
ncbi:MAG: pilus assembly protein [Actinobacteria bacterium]|nr:pilus assembly protein [Actinomycetota bacterium]